MDERRIAELLQPFLRGVSLPGAALSHFAAYLELLQRWNARINLMAVRDAEHVVSRHFGESLFLATRLFPASQTGEAAADHPAGKALDIGAGAGFPGVPLKIYRPQLRLTLVEANQKKATFLREVARALTLRDVEVHARRAEQLIPAPTGTAELQGWPADLVTLRAVERFEVSAKTAARLVASRGTLAMLIGERQARTLPDLFPKFVWLEPEKIPESRERVIAIGKNQEREESTR